MALFFEILEGAQVGSRYKISEGLRIGRRTGEIILNDPKVSSLHAHIEALPDGTLYLVDDDSSNGLLVNNKRVKKVKIIHGVSLCVGRTVLKVTEVFGDAEEILTEPETWQEAIVRILEVVPMNNKPNELHAFQQAVIMKFLQGLQTDESWTLGYGPRIAGSKSLDLRLKDPDAPVLCFALHPEDNACRIKNLSGNQVKLNGKNFSTDIINTGDIVEFGSTQIEFSYSP